MDSARLQRVQALFLNAADLSESEQRTFLEAECGDDGHLMAEVLAMIEEDARGNSLLDRDVAQVARQMLGDSAPSPLGSIEFGPYRILELLGEGGMDEFPDRVLWGTDWPHPNLKDHMGIS